MKLLWWGVAFGLVAVAVVLIAVWSMRLFDEISSSLS